MNPGAGRPITTAAGSSTAGAGLGGPAPRTLDTVRFGRRPTSPSSDSAAGGVGFGFGFGFGNVGWLAIGPGDFFHPWWGGFRGGFGVADIHNAYNVRGGFAPLHGGGFSNLRDLARNDRLRAGMSSMSSRGFGTGTEAVRGVSAESLGGARAITGGGVPISPTRATMRASDRPVNSQSFSAHANQHFAGTAGGGPRIPGTSCWRIQPRPGCVAAGWSEGS